MSLQQLKIGDATFEGFFRIESCHLTTLGLVCKFSQTPNCIQKHKIIFDREIFWSCYHCNMPAKFLDRLDCPCLRNL